MDDGRKRCEEEGWRRPGRAPDIHRERASLLSSSDINFTVEVDEERENDLESEVGGDGNREKAVIQFAGVSLPTTRALSGITSDAPSASLISSLLDEPLPCR